MGSKPHKLLAATNTPRISFRLMEISGVEIVPVKLVITVPYERLAGSNPEPREIIVLVITSNYGLHIWPQNI